MPFCHPRDLGDAAGLLERGRDVGSTVETYWATYKKNSRKAICRARYEAFGTVGNEHEIIKSLSLEVMHQKHAKGDRSSLSASLASNFHANSGYFAI